VLRTIAGPINRRWPRAQRSVTTALVAALACVAAIPAAASAAFTPGDIVVYRVGAGASALSSAATPVFLDEFEPSGKFVESFPLPTAVSGANKPLLASGTASSEGLLTLSGDSNFLLATGYAAAVGTAKVAETTSASVPRTVARVGIGGEANTTTALTDAASANNVRSAASSDGSTIWVGGAAGGVRATTLGASTSTSLNETDKNVREVSVVDGQLYTSADPTKAGALSIATVGSGLPTTAGQTIANLPFSAAPKQPFQYAFLTLGLGSTPDTLYVADNEAGAVVKYGLSGGTWTKEGSVTVTGVSGLTANDANGTVTIFATNSGSEGKAGTIYSITDSSGLGGTLSGSASAIASAPSNEAFRGIAFAPGTVIGSGGFKAPPPPVITTAESFLPAALEDPTNPSLGFTVEDASYEASELTVKASSSNTTVAPTVSVTGKEGHRTLTVTPGAVGDSTITLTAEAPDGTKASTTVTYGVSAYQGDASDRYYAGAGNASSAIDVGGGYMVVADDESDVLRLYHERNSGDPVKTFDFTKLLPSGTAEIDIESSARAGNTLYWMGSLSNKKSGKAAPERDIVFAATITGSGANTQLTYLGSYTHLRENLVAWDEANGDPLGLAASAAAGVPSNQIDGLNAEGLEFAAGSTTTAYLAFRAPLEPPGGRASALLVPVTNFSSLVTGAETATFGSALQWNLGGRGVRELRKNADDQYLVIAGTPDDSNSSFGLYTWNGNPADQPILSATPLSGVAEGAWEDVVSVPDPLVNGSQVELLEDNGESAWYGDGLTSKNGLPAGLQKDIGRGVSVALPAPSAPGAPGLTAGHSPSANGEFTLSWPASKAAGPITYTLQHENASGSGWSTLASGLIATSYAFAGTGAEGEGTWTYRVIASGEGGESEPSPESTAVVVDQTPPLAPSASADRAPDYAGSGGWYRDSVTVSFAAQGDPALADGSPGSGVDPSSVAGAETFSTDGQHVAESTVLDLVGNRSAPGSLTVQVDTSPPVVEAVCPPSTTVGAKGVVATVSASDGQSGLAVDPSGTVPIDTTTAGPQTVTVTAVDNVGHSAEASCTTQVEHDQVITGTVKGTLTIKAGQDVELAPGAHTTGPVKVKPGGSLDIEGATLSGPLSANGASALRICGASVAGAVRVAKSSGPVVIGDGSGCDVSQFSGAVTVSANKAGVTIEGQSLLDAGVFHGSLKVTGNSGGTTVADDEVAGSLTVLGNTTPVVDAPNAVEGKTKVQ
jgi:hypothetical protein